MPCAIKQKVINFAGGVYNHNLYFGVMGNCDDKMPTGRLKNAINHCFGCFDRFKEEFKKAALAQFGSGYAWLVSDNKGNLQIVKSLNQDTPNLCCMCPVLLIDVWEHAYYLKYQNRRPEYISAFWNVINWNEVAERFNK